MNELINIDKGWLFGNRPYGDARNINGNMAHIRGNVSKLSGCCSRIFGAVGAIRIFTTNLDDIQKLIKEFNLDYILFYHYNLAPPGIFINVPVCRNTITLSDDFTITITYKGRKFNIVFPNSLRKDLEIIRTGIKRGIEAIDAGEFIHGDIRINID